MKNNNELETPIGLKECAEFLDKSKHTVYQHVSKREIPFHKKGKKLYFYKSELNTWIKDGAQ